MVTITNSASAKFINLAETRWNQPNTQLGLGTFSHSATFTIGRESIQSTSGYANVDATGLAYIEGTNVVFEDIGFTASETRRKRETIIFERQIPGTFEFEEIEYGMRFSGTGMNFLVPGTQSHPLSRPNNPNNPRWRFNGLSLGEIEYSPVVTLNWEIYRQDQEDISVSGTIEIELVPETDSLWGNIDVRPDAFQFIGELYRDVRFTSAEPIVLFDEEFDGINAQLTYNLTRFNVLATGQFTADFNTDGYIDELDGQIVLNNMYREVSENAIILGEQFYHGDANMNGIVDATDFNIWNYFRVNGANTREPYPWNWLEIEGAIVPEPSSMWLFLVLPFFYRAMFRIPFKL